MQRSVTLQLWTPGLYDFKGGIQVYSGFLQRALTKVFNARTDRAQLDVFSLHDRPRAPRVQAGPTAVRFQGLGHWPGPLRSLAFALGVTLAAVRRRPGLIVTTHVNLAVVADLLGRGLAIPYWVVAHGFEAWEIRKPRVERALRGADRVLCVSDYTRDRLLQTYGLDPARVMVLPNTWDEARFAIAPKPAALLQRHGLRPDQPVILTVNRLAAGEDFHAYDQVLAALPRIRQHLPEVRYLIVGEGNDRPRLEAAIRDQGLTDCVTLAGFIADAELPNYYNLCDCFALPSQLEGFGIVCLEALASGKPVLASLADGSSHALLGGELGLLVDPEDSDAIAQALIDILQGRADHPLIYNPEALRQRTGQEFGQAAFGHQLAAILDQHSPLFDPNAQAPTLRPSTLVPRPQATP